MGGEDDVGEALQGRAEGVRVAAGFDREHVDGGAGEVAGAQCGGGGIDIDNAAAGVVEQVAAGFHGGEFGCADHVEGGGGFGHVQADDVGFRQQGQQGGHGARVAVRELVEGCRSR